MGILRFGKSKNVRVVAAKSTAKRREVTLSIGDTYRKFNMYSTDTLEVDGTLTITQRNSKGGVVRLEQIKTYDILVSEEKEI